MPTVKIGTQRQITLPATTIRRLGMSVGEELEVVESDNAVMLIPSKHVSHDQAWYQTTEWQAMMAEAFAALKQGEVVGPFATVESAIQALKTTPV